MAHGLPDEILAVIPTDPYEQLDLARKLTSLAMASRVSHLEMENGSLRKQVGDKDRVVEELERKIGQLERLIQESNAKVHAAAEENAKILRERDILALTAKKLSSDLNKLEKFKKHLMLSLSEENSSCSEENVQTDINGQLVSSASSLKDEVQHAKSTVYPLSESIKRESSLPEAAGTGRQNYWPTPYITPRLTPTATPSIMSTSVSPRGTSTAGSPKSKASATSPSKSRIEGKIVSTPWYSSSQKTSAANSPPRARPLPGNTRHIDGKEFFRQARNRLSYEQFGAFLANIKELNAHRQTREETLRKAEQIFGRENKDLYLSFHGLLYRR